MDKLILPLLVFLCLLVFFLQPETFKSQRTEKYHSVTYTKACIEGKEFILRGRGITTNLDFDGKPIPCEK